MIYRTFIITILWSAMALVNSCSNNQGPYTDGKYSGCSRSVYTNEPYWGHVTITIKNGWISAVEFQVIDSAKNEKFDDQYEKYFAGNDLYIQQCRNDMEGIRTYPAELIRNHDMEKVDVVTGATWSYNILTSAVDDALKNAKRR